MVSGSINNILRTEESGGSNEWKITQGSSPDGVMAFNVHGMSDELAPFPSCHCIINQVICTIVFKLGKQVRPV